MHKNTEENNFREDVLRAYLARDLRSMRQFFKDSEIADVAELLGSVAIKDSIAMFRLIPRSRRTPVFAYLPFERQESLLEELPIEVVASLLNQMQPDDRTRLFEDLPEQVRQPLINSLEPAEKAIAQRLLSYPEESVGRLMNTDQLSLKVGMSVHQALETIRWNDQAAVMPDHLNRLFVIEPSGELVGEIDLATIVMADPPTTKLVNLMSPATVFLAPEDVDTDAIDVFRKYDRQQIPVVDQNKLLIGFVTADDVFDIAEEDATEDIHQFGGQGALEESYFQTPFHVMLRKRAGWLAVLFLGMMFTGTALRHYEESLDAMKYLVFFLPLIVSSGGNSGTQAASLILRGLAINEMAPRDWFRILRREFLTGLSLGLILAIMGFIRAYFWGYDSQVGFAVSLTLVLVVIFGAVTGSMLPLLFKTTNLDPAVISSPFIATLVDITGIIIFINVALAFL